MRALPNPSIETAPQAGRYLTVSLAGEPYGIAILKVREIIRLQKITPILQTPAYVKGVINLRGRVIPIIDIRAKLGLQAACTEHTCIVVVQVIAADGALMNAGLIVDSVEEVISIEECDVEPAPSLGGMVETRSISGMAKVKGHVETLLDIDHVVGSDAHVAMAVSG